MSKFEHTIFSQICSLSIDILELGTMYFLRIDLFGCIKLRLWDRLFELNNLQLRRKRTNLGPNFPRFCKNQYCIPDIFFKFQYFVFRYNRLWNSIAFILKLEHGESYPLLLAHAAASEHERYRTKPHEHGIGNGETFSKGSIGEKVESKASEEGAQIGDILRLNVAESRDDLAGTVRHVLAWMRHNMPS